jgi:hypothetical protein
MAFCTSSAKPLRLLQSAPPQRQQKRAEASWEHYAHADIAPYIPLIFISGKTRLVLAIAEALQSEFTHGALFVSLVPVTDASLVASAIAP